MGLVACGTRNAPPSQAAGSPLPAIRYEAHLAAGDIAPSGATLLNPHEGDQNVARSGALLFTAMNCDGCHGGEGSGWVGPSLADGRWRYGGADAEVFNSIYYGRPKGMPAFGGTLGAEGVWSLVTYIRSLPVPANVPTESWQER
jgi:cytochrome c oxidase cbb3-type subunit III